MEPAVVTLAVNAQVDATAAAQVVTQTLSVKLASYAGAGPARLITSSSTLSRCTASHSVKPQTLGTTKQCQATILTCKLNEDCQTAVIAQPDCGKSKFEGAHRHVLAGGSVPVCIASFCLYHIYSMLGLFSTRECDYESKAGGVSYVIPTAHCC